MKSRITIEVDFNNGNLPIIQIIQRNSSDVRDNLLQAFLQSLQNSSRWVRIEYDGKHGIWNDGPEQPFSEDAGHRWKLIPIKPDELKEEAKLMNATIADFQGETVPL